MTKIEYENDGINIEQKYGCWAQKRFIAYDDIRGYIGFQKKFDGFSAALGILFISYGSFKIYGMNDLPLSIFFIFAGLYLIYSVIHNYANYKILSVSGNRDLFFSKTDAKNIKRIIEKRNDYFRETYFLNMEKYDATTKIYTANWLYKECAVTEAEILKLDGFFYNAETGKFDYSEKRNEAINEAEI